MEESTKKKPVNWRLLEDVYDNLVAESKRQGFGPNGVTSFVNNHFTRFFKGETMKYEPES